MAIRDRIITEAHSTFGLSNPHKWAREMGILGKVDDDWSYCGCWVRAIWRRVGMKIPDWLISDGNTWYLKRTTTPHVGDLVCLKGKLGHQAIFVRMTSTTITTCDANTLINNVPSMIGERTRPIDEVLCFFAAPVETAGEDEEDGTTRLVKGIDVSSYQAANAINWTLARALGYEYAIVRLTNGIDRDVAAKAHVRRIREAGLVLGAYGFFIPWHEPKKTTDVFFETAEDVGYGQPGDLVPWLDVESWQGKNFNRAAPSWNAPALATASIYAERYGNVGIYLNVSDWVALGKPDWIGQYLLAVAHYTSAAAPVTPGNMQWKWWQHAVSNIGAVYTHELDQSVCLTPLPTIRQTDNPRPVEPQRVDVGMVPVHFDAKLHNDLRNLAVERRTLAEIDLDAERARQR